MESSRNVWTVNGDFQLLLNSFIHMSTSCVRASLRIGVVCKRFLCDRKLRGISIVKQKVTRLLFPLLWSFAKLNIYINTIATSYAHLLLNTHITQCIILNAGHFPNIKITTSSMCNTGARTLTHTCNIHVNLHPPVSKQIQNPVVWMKIHKNMNHSHTVWH